MDMELIPSYRELFGEPNTTYEELVKGVPSHVIITFFIALNNELNTPIQELENQKRLRGIISERFSKNELAYLNSAFIQYKIRTEGNYHEMVFGRRYLVAMILRELKNYRQFDFIDTTPEQEFKMLMAYFMIVDEVHDADDAISRKTCEEMKEDDEVMRLLWVPTINQYEFNDQTDVAYEIFKLLCFYSYALKNYKQFLKEYLNGLSFVNISQFIGSVHQIAMTTFQDRKEKRFRKLNFIKPLLGANHDYLLAQTINKQINGGNLLFSDIKKNPLFITDKGEYLVIDEDAYKKKVFRGPFFELRALTGLNKKINFNKYSGEISYEVLEKMTFRSIMKALQSSAKDVIHFDDFVENAPDCYFRIGNTIFLFEFKGYAFPIELTSNPEFDLIKSYIDSRFVNNDEGSAKGISQLNKQINILLDSGFEFDQMFRNESSSEKITIFPIICHSEFFFSLPGVNEYLSNKFMKLLTDKAKEEFHIAPLTLIDLKYFFDLVIHGLDIIKLETFITKYHRIFEARKLSLGANFTNANFFRSKASFDETYRVEFQSEVLRSTKGNCMPNLLKIASITQTEIDEVL